MKAEAALMQTMNHTNIIRFIGTLMNPCCTVCTLINHCYTTSSGL
jgi:hypothetical protein